MSGSPSLRLYTRVGCCLCEGLEERLRTLLLTLDLVDVDGDPGLQVRYGLRVPVLALADGAASVVSHAGDGAGEELPLVWRDLPPVPPRLAGERLRAWLAAHGAVAGASVAGELPGGEGL
jgi:hypothetical protein